ncbi:MAG: TonB-dependent receptor [Tannerella sp.]|nr:TonB-dependent receptor [Tannerella sp.]
MRLTLFLLLLFTGFVYANEANSQNARVNLNARNAALKDVLEDIENQTDYLFVSNRDINLAQSVSIRVKNKSVSDVLNRLFENTDMSYAMEGVNIILSRKANTETGTAVAQQKKTVTGTVVDNYGEPVIGANIIEKGTINGILTDIDGRFSLAVDEGAVLRVSYIGYITQEVSVGNRSSLSITLLEDLQALDEVIVIGYGTAKRKDFTGSVSSVRLEDSPVALASNLSALEAIKGNVSGLDIGASNYAGEQPSMQMRGQKSISGSNDPLIVVDGVIFLGNINDINPNDIASFDILKDATSAAAYGSRSANGVIIITTKKGRTAKPVITLNASGSMQSWNNRPKLMKGEQWLESVMARNNSTDLTWLKPQETANMQAGKETDWLDASTRTGWVQDYQLSVSGSGEKMNYYLSTAYSDNESVIVGDQYNRISVLGKINTDITDWLQIGLDAAYTKSDYSGAGANIYQATVMSPYAVLYRDEANKLLEKYPYTQSGINPLWGVTDGSRDNLDKRDNLRMNAYAVVKLPWLPGLSYRFNYASNLMKENKGDFYYETSYVREGSYDDESRYSPSAYQDLLSRANGNRDNRTTSSWVIDNILNYNRTFGKHTIDLTAVATRDRKDYTREVMRGSDFSANGNTTLGINGLHKATVQRVELEADRRANIGYLGRASYSFDDKYFLTGSYRRDGASVFGANQKWGNFVAVGAAWRITNENFMNRVDFLNDLKLKLSWGKNGNQGLDPYGTLSTIKNSAEANARYEFGNSSNILYGMITGALGNANLGWESTESWNTGFESAWLGNRVFLDLDVYFSKTTDQIFTRNIPVMTGFKEMKSSMGQIDNHGVEITLRTVNIEKRDLMWMTGFTFWLNRNKLVHLYGEDLDGDGKEDDDISNSRFIGKSLGAIYGYVQDGIVQESDTEYMQKNGVQAGVPKYKDLDKDGVITTEDRDILGYDKPNFKLNMSNTVSWKNFDLYAMLTGSFGGGDYYLKANREAYMTNGSGSFNTNSIYIPWWTPENKSNVYPSAVFTGDGGRFQGLQNRGFVRLQDVTLSYTFREPWVKDLNLQNLKVFLTAKNLFTITKWEGDDPEVGSTVRADNSNDIRNVYPVLTSFSLGVNISF